MKKGLQETECLFFQSAVLSSTNPMYEQTIGKTHKTGAFQAVKHTVHEVTLRLQL